MDKNNATGLLLISVLLLGYFLFFAPEPPPVDQPSPTSVDSVSTQSANAPQASPNQSLMANMGDSAAYSQFGVVASGLSGQATEYVLENASMSVYFSSHGASIQKVVLKNYVTYSKETLVLLEAQHTRMSEILPFRAGKVDLYDLYYQVEQRDNALVFALRDSSGQALERVFTLPPTGFTINYQVRLNGLQNLLDNTPVRFDWYNDMRLLEKDMAQSRNQSTVNYFTLSGTFDYLSETSTDPEERQVDEPVSWVAMKQKFFNTGILTDRKFEQVKVASAIDSNDPLSVKETSVALSIPLADYQDAAANLRFYFGPNDYDICETVALGYEKNVYLGWAFFSTINLYVIIPIFKFLEGFFSNYGIIILILVFIVKTALFPLQYRSYVSMAKMRVLKPEMDEIRAKFPDDMQAQQQEQMKLYSQVGVNPLSGCIPILLQMPVFLAMFNFFPNAIQLRQKGFLWADDLSSYDSVLDLPFSIPFYGDHVSMFCLLMTISQLIYTYYNNQLNPTANQGPVNMQAIAYTTPVIFLFFLNSFSSGLTYYYFVSNLITVGQQLLIKGFIDEGKIRRILDENKKKNEGKGKSKFQQRLEDYMKSQEQKPNIKPDNKGKGKKK